MILALDGIVVPVEPETIAVVCLPRVRHTCTQAHAFTHLSGMLALRHTCVPLLMHAHTLAPTHAQTHMQAHTPTLHTYMHAGTLLPTYEHACIYPHTLTH